MTLSRLSRLLRIISALILLTTTACSGPGFYVQAASGHWKLMRARQDVADVISDPETDPVLVQRLETARGIIEYAGTELGLPASDSYTGYVETGRSAVAWNVVATPEFSLAPKTWCFLVAGCVPYRGYFNESRAEKSARRLSGKGLDVSVTPVTAYSTLGWFRDPLLDTMLARRDLQLAATLIHELAHQRLYLKGNTGFNEGYARFVERIGVQNWLEDTGRMGDLEQWRALRQASRDFNEILMDTREKLAALYNSDSSEAGKRSAKKRIIEDLRLSYRDLVLERWQGRDYFAAWFSADINNAHLALINAYEGSQCAFAALFRDADGDFHEFHRLAASRAALEKGQLQSWLAQACDAVAPDGDL